MPGGEKGRGRAPLGSQESFQMLGGKECRRQFEWGSGKSPEPLETWEEGGAKNLSFKDWERCESHKGAERNRADKVTQFSKKKRQLLNEERDLLLVKFSLL